MTGKGSQTVSMENPLEGDSYTDNSSKDQERFLPIANVSRIMKQSLPPNAKISKEAKETVQECVSEFISFITGEASDKCQREKRKTINGDDLLWAMTTLGFENYVAPVKVYLNKYRVSEMDNTSVAQQEEGTIITSNNGKNSHTEFNKENHEISGGEYYSMSGRFISYGENFTATGFNMSKLHENVDGNVSNRDIYGFLCS